jgi:peroxiredoxin
MASNAIIRPGRAQRPHACTIAMAELKSRRPSPSHAMKKYIAATAVALAVVAGVGVYFGSGATAAPASTFVLLDGSKKTTDDLKGKVTLVNFWATSCVTCVAEMPQVITTYDKYKARGYDTLAVAMSYDPPSYVVNFAETRKLPFKVAIDNTGSVAQAWGDVKLTPTTYLVNKKGEIVKRYVGAPDFAELHKLIEKLLAEA